MISGWSEKDFGDIVDIGNGQVDPKIEPYSNYFHIGPENVRSETGQISELQKAKELGLISGKYLFDEEAIVYSKIRPNLNKVCVPDFSGICSADMYPIWVKKGIVDKYYLYLFMKSSLFVKPAIKASMRTGLPKINRQDLFKIKVTFPSDIEEQKRIASLLMTWENALNKTEQLIDQKTKKFDWLVTSLINKAGYDKCHISLISSESSIRNRNSSIQQVLSVTNRNGFVLSEEQFEHRVASENLENYKVVKHGQYAYNPSRINVGSIARLDDWEEGVLSPMYTVFGLDDSKINSDYFLHWLSSHEAKGRIRLSAQGSVRETVSFRDLGAILIPLPDLVEQERAAKILNTAKKEIDLLKKLAKAYKLQKRGLMQKLLTGEWRVDRQKAS